MTFTMPIYNRKNNVIIILTILPLSKVVPAAHPLLVVPEKKKKKKIRLKYKRKHYKWG